MNEHRAQLVEILDAGNVFENAFFVLLCAERLRACYWAHKQLKKNFYVDPFQWADIVFNALAEKKMISNDRAMEALEMLSVLVPVDGEPLSVQAQSGLQCLMLAIEMLAELDVNASAITDASNWVIDALDNYAFFVRSELDNDFESPTSEDPLLVREIGHQIFSASLIGGSMIWDFPNLVKYRIWNLQFAVPIAVL